MATVEKFYAETGSIYIDDEDGDQDFSAQVREISIRGGDRDYDTIYTFHANEFRDLDRMGALEASITTIKGGSEAGLARFVLGGSGASTTYPTKYVGDGSRFYPNLVYSFVEGQNQLKIVMSGAVGVSKEMSVDAEGYIEETVGFKILPSDYTEHWTSSLAGSPLPV